MRLPSNLMVYFLINYIKLPKVSLSLLFKSAIIILLLSIGLSVLS
jgi:hypothetical protein